MKTYRVWVHVETHDDNPKAKEYTDDTDPTPIGDFKRDGPARDFVDDIKTLANIIGPKFTGFEPTDF